LGILPYRKNLPALLFSDMNDSEKCTSLVLEGHPRFELCTCKLQSMDILENDFQRVGVQCASNRDHRLQVVRKGESNVQSPHEQWKRRKDDLFYFKYIFLA
jgi:hypothetical protein